MLLSDAGFHAKCFTSCVLSPNALLSISPEGFRLSHAVSHVLSSAGLELAYTIADLFSPPPSTCLTELSIAGNFLRAEGTGGALCVVGKNYS